MNNKIGQRKADMTRDKLILSAINILSKEGYIAFSENRICEDASVTRGALRYHFPEGRYDLIKELTEILFKKIPTSELTGVARIKELILFMIENPVQNPIVLIMEIWLATFADKRLADTINDILNTRYKYFFGVDKLEQLPAELVPFRFMFWGAILSLHNRNTDNYDLDEVLSFLDRQALF
ncbi:TPA: TetR/AcrR family transcriptional regulator [Klebsiella aerogenes]|nr:TetR/AcrR family transcriptional regulator [Klebsiella aerogenes]